MKTTTNNPHKWFFACIADITDNEERDEVRKALVFDYSDGKTESLTELYTKYPRKYAKMRNDMTSKTQADKMILDKARKRLIAAVFTNLERRGLTPTTDYVKRVACKAAGVSRFNDIELNKLKALYRQFGEKNVAMHMAWADEILNSISL